MPETTPVRTIYLPVLRSLLPSMHELFDFPDPSQIKGQREVTTVPAQALFFLNSRLATDAAHNAAQRLLDDATLRTDEARVTRAYVALFGREPSPDESKDARSFLSGMTDAPAARWSALVQALMASSEFRYVW